MEKTIKLSPPWYTYYHELEALFEKDPDVMLRYDEDAQIIKLYVATLQKASALSVLLKPEKVFGNVTVKVEVIPPNIEDKSISDKFSMAFDGNPALDYVTEVESPMGVHRFAVFQNKVVQFYNDQLDDPYGNKSTLYQDIAADVFADGLGIHFCTRDRD